MEESLFRIVILILISGFIGGVLLGASLETGEPIDPGSQMIKIFKSFCDSVKSLFPDSYFVCREYLGIIIISSFVVGIAEILELTSKIGDASIGTILYVLSFIIGLIIYVVR
jgi:hypothetical protein